MPDDIERTIYRLELDGSAYIEGVEKAAASTKKLSEAQAEANAKLAGLTAQQANYIKQLDTANAIIKANETETLNLSKRYNEIKDRITAINTSLTQLKANFKGNSTEAKVLQAELKTLNNESKTLQSQMKAITLNTKEFRIEQATLKTSLAQTNVAVKTTTKEIASLEAGTGNLSKGLTKAYSGLRVLANIIPGLGIAGLVTLIAGPLISAITDWVKSLDLVGDKLHIVDEVIQGADESSQNLRAALRSLGDTAEEIATNAFKKLDDELNKLKDDLGETPNAVEIAQGALQILKTDIDNLKAALEKTSIFDFFTTGIDPGNLIGMRQNIQKQIDIQSKLITEGEQKLNDIRIENAKLALLGQREVNQKILEDNIKLNVDANNKIAANEKASLATRKQALSDNLNQTLQLNRIERDREINAAKDNETKKALAEENFRFANLKAQADYNEKIKNLKVKEVKEAANIYLKELQKLKSDIAKAEAQGFTSEENIRKAIEADFKMREDAYKEAYSKKQLTRNQLKSLQDYLSRLQTITLDTQLKTFREQKQAYLDQINDEITSLQFEESTKRIAAIQDNFERERQTIITETDKTVSTLEQKRDARIAQIVKDAAKNGLKPEEIQPQIDQIKATYEKLLDDLQVIKNQKLQQLSFETFEALTEDAKRLLDANNLKLSEDSLARIQQQAELFRIGAINFKEYQEALTKIAKDEGNKRFENEKAFLEAEIKRRDEELFAGESLTPDQEKKLRDEITRLRQQLADAEKGNITSNITDPTAKKVIDRIVEYANAIGTLTQSVIGFWQQTNQAEQEALERSIALQEQRVDAAQKLADRGNAQYLKAEEDRLNDLNVKRENAARKQLAINAALQGSEILVALISSIAQGAKIGGAIGAIIDLAAIVTAIAGAFAIAESLKPPEPTFFLGTKDTGKGGAKDAKGGFGATLHPHEAVIPEKTNKEYHPAVSAIYDRTIPAEELNRFVTTYHKIKPIPQVNHELIKEAASIHIEHDGKMSVLLQEHTSLLKENNELQREILGKKIHVENHVDKNGVATMVTEYLEKKKRERKI